LLLLLLLLLFVVYLCISHIGRWSCWQGWPIDGWRSSGRGEFWLFLSLTSSVCQSMTVSAISVRCCLYLTSQCI